MANDIGVMASLREEGPCFSEVKDFGLSCCQLVSWNASLWSADRAAEVKAESESTGVRMTSLWAGWPGPAKWNFTEGPTTLGIVPKEHRAERVEALAAAGPFAKALDVPAVITHLGFIPENPTDPEFPGVVETVKELAEGYAKLGIEFWFETGQETPITMLRLIEQVGTGNLGINLDPANLILYGRGNPIDALDVFGKYVRNVHAKDGVYPTEPMSLGHEVVVGEGKVRFPEFVERLREIGYTGEYIIEREISGEKQKRDIALTVDYLKKLIGN